MGCKHCDQISHHESRPLSKTSFCVAGIAIGITVTAFAYHIFRDPATYRTRDVNGDAVPDLIFTTRAGRERVLYGRPDGTFYDPRTKQTDKTRR